MMDRLKATVPIWKNEMYEDGSSRKANEEAFSGQRVFARKLVLVNVCAYAEKQVGNVSADSDAGDETGKRGSKGL